MAVELRLEPSVELRLGPKVGQRLGPNEFELASADTLNMPTQSEVQLTASSAAPPAADAAHFGRITVARRLICA